MQKIIIPLLSISLLSSIIYATSIETNPETIIEKENRETILKCVSMLHSSTGSNDMKKILKECESIPLRSITGTHSTGSSVLPPKGLEISNGDEKSQNHISSSETDSIKTSTGTKNETISLNDKFWKTYEIAIPLIRKYEGLQLRAYWDYNGYSIGYGTRAKHAGEVITQDEADTRLGYIVKQVVTRVQADFPTLSSEQQAGLVSFAFNCEQGYRSVRDNGLKFHGQWCKTAGNKIIQGLVERRKEESRLIFK